MFSLGELAQCRFRVTAFRDDDCFASRGGRSGCGKGGFVVGSADLEEVDGSVDGPDGGDGEGEQGLVRGAEAAVGADEVEGHAGEVREQAEDGDEQVAEDGEALMLVIGHDAEGAA